MKCYDLQPFTIPITQTLLNHTKLERKRNFDAQQNRIQNKIKTSTGETMQQIEELKGGADTFALEAEKKSEMEEVKPLLSKELLMRNRRK